MEKETIIKLFLEHLSTKRNFLAKECDNYRKAASEAPSAMESHSDTSKNQFEKLVDDIEKQIKIIDDAKNLFIKSTAIKNNTVDIGSLVIMSNSEKQSYFLVVPSGTGGSIINFKETEIMAISPDSSFGKVLFGKKEGDSLLINDLKILKVW